MTAVSTVQENVDGSHHGVKIEVIQSAPSIYSSACVKWTSSKNHKRDMAEFGHSFSLIAICRDRGCEPSPFICPTPPLTPADALLSSQPVPSSSTRLASLEWNTLLTPTTVFRSSAV